MKRFYLFVVISFILFGMVSCFSSNVGDDRDYDNVTIKIAEENFDLKLLESENLSLLELIEDSEIDVDYYETDFGNMLTKVGSVEEDSFHWIAFTKNGEPAELGIDSITYEDGDEFEFIAELKTWPLVLLAEYQGIEDESYLFALEDEYFYIESDNLPVSWTNEFYQGMAYEINGSINQEKLDEEYYYINPESISEIVITDFTELYDIDEGDIVYIGFRVTEIEDGSVFGNEFFAEDINGLSSKDISVNMTPSYTTDYIFYTLPEEITIEVGSYYIGRFVYDTFEPNNNPQLALTEANFFGEESDYFIEEIEE